MLIFESSTYQLCGLYCTFCNDWVHSSLASLFSFIATHLFSLDNIFCAKLQPTVSYHFLLFSTKRLKIIKKQEYRRQQVLNGGLVFLVQLMFLISGPISLAGILKPLCLTSIINLTRLTIRIHTFLTCAFVGAHLNWYVKMINSPRQ